MECQRRYSSGNIPLRKEHCFHLRSGLILHVREHMSIGVERKGCAGMSQLLRHHLWRHPGSQCQSGGRVMQTIQSDPWQAV